MRTGLRVLIADDEPLARERIRSLLSQETDIEIVAECADGTSAVETILAHKPDLVFLDIEMPELDGFGVLESVGPERIPAIIFITAYDKYALRAFEAHALDYLLKPFDRERFQRALARARQRIEQERESELGSRLRAMLQDMRSEPKFLERLAIRSGGRVVFLRVDEVDWIGAAGNYVELHVGREIHLLRDTMNSIEGKLDPQKFMRIHRSSIVNVERIKELHAGATGDYTVVLQNGMRLTLSRSYRDKLDHLVNSAAT